VESGLLLDVVVRQCSAIFQLLAGEDQSLLVWGDALFILNLGLHVFDGIRCFDFEGDGLPGQSFDEDLHTTTKTEDQVESGLLLDVVIRQGSTIFQLLSRENQPLLVWGDSFLVLDFCFHILDGVGGFDFECDGFAG